MRIRRLLAGALIGAMCGMGRLAVAKDARSLFIPNTFSSLEIAPDPVVAGAMHHMGRPMGSMQFVTATGPKQQFDITSHAELGESEPGVTTKHVGGTEYSKGSYERPTTPVVEPPCPNSQIIYGWVPDKQEQVSLATLNLAELSDVLGNKSFISALKSRAVGSSVCSYVIANNRESYLEGFRRAVEAEKNFRQQANEQRTAIENELHENKMAPKALSYDVSGNIAAGHTEDNPGEDEGSGSRYKETVERLMATRLEMLLTCKLAALLAQPGIFLNSQISVLDALDMLSEALGVAGSTTQQGIGNAVAFGGLEPFLMASNPITLGHLLILLIGQIDRDLFFGPNAKKRFYTFMTLMGATGGESGIIMLDEMCDRDRGPHYKTNLLQNFKEKLRKKEKGRVRGSAKPWFIRGIKRVHRNAGQPELLRAYCDTTEMILGAIMMERDNMQQEMENFSLAVEPLVDPATNAARIQTRTCRGEAPACAFENTILNPAANPLDPEVIGQNTSTRKAYALYTGLGSAYVGSLLDSASSGYSSIRAEQWVDIISKPTAYYEILEKVFYFDSREMISKTESKMIKAFNAYATRVPELKGKLTITLDAARGIYSTIWNRVSTPSPGMFKKKTKLTKKNLFRSAIVTYLMSNMTCDMKTSFAWKLSQFTQSMFQTGSRAKNGLPAAQRSLMAFFRTTKAPALYSMCSFDPLTIVYLFLYRFVLLGEDAGKTHDKQRALISRSRLSTRILGSKWTPNIIKTVMRGLGRKTYVKRAKELLLESLDASVLPFITSSFNWIVHSQAALQLNQNTFLYHNLGTPPQNYQTTADTAWRLGKTGLVKHTDKQLESWAKHGIPASLADKLRKGEKLPKVLAFEKIPTPDLTHWDSQLNALWLEGLTAYVNHPYGQAGLEANDPIAHLIHDSKTQLEATMGSTIFLGRIVKPTRVSKFRRALSTISNFFRSLIRAPAQSEYAVWMGVSVNIDKVMTVMKAVNSAAEVVKSSGVYDHIREGFLDIVKDVIMGNLNSHRRIVGYDTYAAVNEQMRKEGLAAAHKRNHAFLSVHPDYGNLNEAERKKEFQQSMCMDHCEALWKLVTSLVLTNLQNPAKLAGYEKEMSETKAIEQLTNPNRVNAFRLGLSVQLDYFDTLLDKGSKENIKRMKYGGGTWFSYSLKLAGQVNTAMGMPNLGTTLAFQAPFYGEFILRWLKERREARKKAILAMLTLGFFFAYTLLSVTDITQHLQDSGLGPAVQCLESSIVGPLCPAEVIAPAITKATTTAMQDVLKVGVFGLLTPYLVWPMMLISVWQILKSEFKVLLQFEMSVKSLFTRFSRWVKRPFSNWWKRRKRVKENIMKKASQKYESEKRANNGQEPQPTDFVGRKSHGWTELDALDIPKVSEIVTFEMPSAPIYPRSPPLVRANSAQ